MTGRHGHTACAYKDSIIIFGGEGPHPYGLKHRECYFDVRMFSPEHAEWSYMSCNGKPITSRRNHAACIVDTIMFVYGGIDSEGLLLDETWGLNLSNI